MAATNRIFSCILHPFLRGHLNSGVFGGSQFGPDRLWFLDHLNWRGGCRRSPRRSFAKCRLHKATSLGHNCVRDTLNEVQDGQQKNAGSRPSFSPTPATAGHNQSGMLPPSTRLNGHVAPQLLVLSRTSRSCLRNRGQEEPRGGAPLELPQRTS